MKSIKIGDPQPHPCPRCGMFYGYQVTENIKGTYMTIYLSDGTHYEGTYGDSVTTTKRGTRAYCANCAADLKLKITY